MNLLNMTVYKANKLYKTIMNVSSIGGLVKKPKIKLNNYFIFINYKDYSMDFIQNDSWAKHLEDITFLKELIDRV